MSIQDKIYNYFERDLELRVLFIFNDPFLRVELEEVLWPEDYQYVEFRGDWFTTKCRLDNEWSKKKVVLYFDQPSPLGNKILQEKFPLMDILVANMEYRHQDYAAFMQQYHLPQAMATFVEKNIIQLQSDRMMRLLQPYYDDGTINEDIATRAFLSSNLGQQRIWDWDNIILRVITQGRESERSKQTDFHKKLCGSRMIYNALNAKLSSIFGVGLEDNDPSKVEKIVHVLKYNAIAQNLSPIKADDYKGLRISDSLALQRMNRLLELALSQPKTAKAFSDTLKELGGTIRVENLIQWYGTDADYYFVPTDMCVPILRNLMRERIEKEPGNVKAKVEELMLKQSGNSDLSQTMDYITLAAHYYEFVSGIGSITLSKPDDYVRKYEKDWYQADLIYRQVSDCYYQITPTETLFDDVQKVKSGIDHHYAKFCNRLNLEWMKCIIEVGGLKSLHLPLQKDFYDTHIKKMQKKVAVIVSDALRYEMAQELIGELAKSKHSAKLSMMLAMLPTETKYCKPVLLPHKEIELCKIADDLNMSVDNKVLSTTADRSTHLENYKDDAIAVTFEEVAKYNTAHNIELFKHTLVYVFHDEIDDTGHDGSPKKVVETCRQAIKDIATMIPRIHATYNVTEVYVTSDHGFLFNDMDFAEKDKLPVTEDTLERKSRYYLTHSKEKQDGIAKFPLSEVSGMTNASDVYVAVPEGTNRFAAPSGGYMFTHGGASLQEILIPLIVSRMERTDTKQPVGVMVLNRNLSIQSSRLRFYLLQTEAVNMDAKERTVTVGLYHNDQIVSTIKTIQLDKTAPSLDDRKILVDLTLNKHVESNLLQLRVYDASDTGMLNPLCRENVTNNTLIEQDDF